MPITQAAGGRPQREQGDAMQVSQSRGQALGLCNRYTLFSDERIWRTWCSHSQLPIRHQASGARALKRHMEQGVHSVGSPTSALLTCRTPASIILLLA